MLYALNDTNESVMLSDPSGTIINRAVKQQVIDGTATAFTAVGFSAALTITAASNNFTNTNDTDGPWINSISGTVSGNVASFAFAAFTQTRRDWEPELIANIKTDASTITSTRLWIGLFS